MEWKYKRMAWRMAWWTDGCSDGRPSERPYKCMDGDLGEWVSSKCKDNIARAWRGQIWHKRSQKLTQMLTRFIWTDNIQNIAVCS